MWGQIRAFAFLRQRSCDKLLCGTYDHRSLLRYRTLLRSGPSINKTAYHKVHFEIRPWRKVFLKLILPSLLDKLIERSECFRRGGMFPNQRVCGRMLYCFSHVMLLIFVSPGRCGVSSLGKRLPSTGACFDLVTKSFPAAKTIQTFTALRRSPIALAAHSRFVC